MDTGIDVNFNEKALEFVYGKNVMGPKTEKRDLNSIRQSLLDSEAIGPKYPYVIAMDVYEDIDHADLLERNLLYGIVRYSSGKIGNEPVRSQGHIHSVSEICHYSTPEVYEIWKGEAIIYMQEYADKAPGRCYAVYGKPGDVIIVPPYWVHATINANPLEEMIFGAWCVRDYSFEYDKLRELRGIAYYPIFSEEVLTWKNNDNYTHNHKIVVKKAREYPEFNIKKNEPIYRQYQQDNSRFDFVTKPEMYKVIWDKYLP